MNQHQLTVIQGDQSSAAKKKQNLQTRTTISVKAVPPAEKGELQQVSRVAEAVNVDAVSMATRYVNKHCVWDPRRKQWSYMPPQTQRNC